MSKIQRVLYQCPTVSLAEVRRAFHKTRLSEDIPVDPTALNDVLALAERYMDNLRPGEVIFFGGKNGEPQGAHGRGEERHTPFREGPPTYYIVHNETKGRKADPTKYGSKESAERRAEDLAIGNPHTVKYVVYKAVSSVSKEPQPWVIKKEYTD